MREGRKVEGKERKMEMKRGREGRKKWGKRREGKIR